MIDLTSIQYIARENEDLYFFPFLFLVFLLLLAMINHFKPGFYSLAGDLHRLKWRELKEGNSIYSKFFSSYRIIVLLFISGVLALYVEYLLTYFLDSSITIRGYLTVFIPSLVLFIIRFLIEVAYATMVDERHTVNNYLSKTLFVNLAIFKGLVIVMLVFQFMIHSFSFLAISSGILFLLWIYYQSIVLLSLINSKRIELFYIIIYLCTLKIAFWFLLYRLILEVKFN